MGKLSISTVRLSALEGAKRVDADFYQPHYLEMVKRLSRYPKLAEYEPTVIHPVEVKREYEDEGLQLLFAQNIKPNRLDFSHVAFLPASLEAIIRKNKLQVGDVLVTRTGANYGDAACYLGKPSPLYASAHCLVIRASEVPGPYLATFFNTDTGRALLKRGAYGTSQPELAPDYIRSLRVPRDTTIEKQVEEKTAAAAKEFERADNFYAQAQQLLLETLGLDTLQLDDCVPQSIRQVSEVLSARRMDAEYFQEKYDRVLSHLEREGALPLGQLIAPIVNGFDCRDWSDYGTIYIRVGDIRPEWVDLGNALTVSMKAADVKKDVHLKEGDVLFTRKGTFGVSAVARGQDIDCLISSEIMRLRLKDQSQLLPEALSAFLNSQAGYLQVERYVHGHSHYSISQPDLRRLLIWLPPKELQKDIQLSILHGHEARRHAEKLLAEAKAEVERLIEG